MKSIRKFPKFMHRNGQCQESQHPYQKGHCPLWVPNAQRIQAKMNHMAMAGGQWKVLDYISRIFDVCFRDKGYHKSVVDTTYVVKDLVYSKENIRIVFTCELMENAFDFEICFSSMGKPYSVCEQVERRKMHYQNIGINVIHQSIFEYTNGVWDVASFQNEKEKLLHKNYKLGRSRKLFQESVILYRLLLFPAIERIEQIVNN